MRALPLLCLFFFALPLCAQDWKSALASTPFPGGGFQAHNTEPVDRILKVFKPTPEMRAVVLMPAAADQLYFFNWGKIELPEKASLLDALNALTNKAHLRYSFVEPFLLLHLDRDTTSDPLVFEADSSAKLTTRKRKGKLYFLDRPYDKILPELDWLTGLKSIPDARSSESFHYYRLSFVGYDLSVADYLRAMAYGTKTSVTIDKRRATFQDRPFLKNESP